MLDHASSVGVEAVGQIAKVGQGGREASNAGCHPVSTKQLVGAGETTARDVGEERMQAVFKLVLMHLPAVWLEVEAKYAKVGGGGKRNGHVVDMCCGSVEVGGEQCQLGGGEA